MIYLFLSFFTRKTRLCTLKCSTGSTWPGGPPLCSNNEKCIEGQCQSKCSNDDHCEREKREKCYQRFCVKSCEGWGAIATCPEDRYCHLDDKVCLFSCKSDKNCNDGYRCSKGGQCLKSCRDDSQCSNTSNGPQYCHK